LVIHAWWGLTSSVREFCDGLAREGFIAVAPDLFAGHVAATPAEARRLRAERRRAPTYKTLTAVVARLEAQEPKGRRRVGVVGFSMGGHWALWLSQRPALPIAACVTYYGARSGDFSRSRASYQGHFAEHDPWVSPAALARLKRALHEANRPAEFYEYPGTGHWFAESDRTDAFRPRAAAQARTRTVRFLQEALKT
jgi:carboxymethylenebutenolidase